AGYKVAVCEQMEDPKDTKGIVKREVVRVITPGTHTPEHPKENNYIMSFMPRERKHGIALADVSTGEFMVYETEKPLEDEIGRFEPKEILIPESLRDNFHYAGLLKDHYVSAAGDWRYDYPEAYKSLLKHFRVSSLEGYGCEGMTAAIQAAGALVGYIEEMQVKVTSLRKISLKNETSYMFLDAPAQRNLELIRNLKDGSTEGTLLWALDETLTPMGGRFLRNAILMPLTDVKAIRKRQNAVGYLVEDYELVETLRKNLRKVQDIERLERKVSTGTANARDLIALKTSAACLPEIKNSLLSSRDGCLKELGRGVSDFGELITLIDRGITEHPPIGLRDGGIIRDGWSGDIDELRDISRNGKGYIAAIETEEKQKTGINSLKVGYNRIFGYYIEVTNANLGDVPDRYIRKQTLVGAERFITPELKEYEAKVLGAEERLKGLEYQAFQGILQGIGKDSLSLLASAHSISEADFLLSLSVVAKRHDYAKPQVDDDVIIKITEGRHPVLERLSLSERFIPNSLYLDGNSQRLLVITGPNMAGKSTYMRQSALIVLMAQMGGFVPAEDAVIGVADRIFTRIGASDFLTRGQSTFMVEMIEAASILNNATDRSLIILDEIGRGTSTFDGISIAWAAAEYIVKELKARTLFATHYNELTELAHALETVKNYNVSVREWGDEIIFLRKIEEGPADKSYGIQVARLAGIPDKVIKKAKEVLSTLEKEEFAQAGAPRFAGPQGTGQRQLDLFTAMKDALLMELRTLDIKGMSAEKALEKLRELKTKAEPLS
ncbi:MAG: DNA mismatch repair protein MutS, partial [Thermodesulfovibrionales bacterium]|nr:DNA mismatch repair protein MutS [Thermodesulfovibrionales bacterium]